MVPRREPGTGDSLIEMMSSSSRLVDARCGTRNADSSATDTIDGSFSPRLRACTDAASCAAASLSLSASFARPRVDAARLVGGAGGSFDTHSTSRSSSTRSA